MLPLFQHGGTSCQSCIRWNEQHWWTSPEPGLEERSWRRSEALLRWLEVCQTILRLPLTEDGLETHGAEIRSIICLINLLLQLAAALRSQVGLAENGSVGNLVPSSGDQRGVGGSTINNRTAPLRGAPDKHGISFVLSNLLFSFNAERECWNADNCHREGK